MRPVSIEDFINVVFEYDSTPPAPSTIRRLCAAKDEFGLAVIPGAFKLGKAWKIDLDGCPDRTLQKTPLSMTWQIN